MPSDYEIVGSIARNIQSIIAAAGKKVVDGKKLSEEKIDYELSTGTYANFCSLVDELKKIAQKHQLGYYSKLELLRKFNYKNWAELLLKARLLLGIAKELQLRLTPLAQIQIEDEEPIDWDNL